jgi:hypothetical protein
MPSGAPWRARSSQRREASVLFSFVPFSAYAQQNKNKGASGELDSLPQT